MAPQRGWRCIPSSPTGSKSDSIVFVGSGAVHKTPQNNMMSGSGRGCQSASTSGFAFALPSWLQHAPRASSRP
eukprot:2710684-Alexandrium_andersonii.AAC.1